MAYVMISAVFMVFCIIFKTGECYPKGAPMSQCIPMTPNHGVSAQSGSSPYTIKTANPYYVPGENVRVSIESSSDKIKGYLIQAQAWDKFHDRNIWQLFLQMQNMSLVTTERR